MNSRIRILIFLVSVTASFALAFLSGLNTFAAESNNLYLLRSQQTAQTGPMFIEADENFDLTININGEGSVKKEVDQETTDQTKFNAGEVVTLTAQATSGWIFIDWSGDITGTTSPYYLTMDDDYNITATFERLCYELELNHTGDGSDPVVTIPVNNHSPGCPDGQFVEDEEITVLADPANNYSVASWEGIIGSPNPTNLTETFLMPKGDHTVTVNYQAICYSLNLTSDPSQGGTIEPTEGTCPYDQSLYIVGTQVGLEAKSNNGYRFDSWEGTDNDSSSDNSNKVTMTGDKSVTANFDLSCHPLTITHTPSEGGSTVSVSARTPSSCAPGEYVKGQKIDITVQPSEGWRVERWTGMGGNNNSTSSENTLTFPALPNGSGHVVGVRYIPKPTLEFTLGLYQINEDGGIATIDVERTGSTTEEVNVSYLTTKGTADPGKDYVSTSGTLTFLSGDTKESFEVQILNDQISEGIEVLNLILINNSANSILGEQDTAELEILDDEGELTIQFQTTNYEVQEISPTLPISITLSTPADQDIFVRFRTQAETATKGEDYLEHSEIVPFFAGETVKRVDVRLLDDDLDEPLETVKLQILEPNGPLLDEATMTIIDDDDPPAVKFSESEYFAKEGEQTIPISVTLSAPSALAISVDYEIIEVSVGRQFIGNLIFQPGEVIQTIDVPIAQYQVGDTLNIILSEPENATLSSPSSASLVILDKDRSECHPLTMNFTGYGSQPLTTNLEKSLGCPPGHFVADELIFVSAQPDPGWVVDGWSGTLDDNLKTVENIVRMPDGQHIVSVFYITKIYLPSTSHNYITYFSGSNEKEPNDTLMQANGPIRSNQEYVGGFTSTSDMFDNYYFQQDALGSVQIQLSDIPTGRDYNLLLLSEDQELVGYSGSLNNDDEFISVGNLEPGLYYVSVHFAMGSTSTAKYSLNVIYN